jgi:predicted N-acetyltransferase YhbS
MITIERATEADIPAIHEVIQIAFIREAERVHCPTIQPLQETVEQLRALMGEIVLFAARADGKIVGTGRAIRKGETTTVGRLAVLPGYQRQGIATQLIREIEKAYPESTRYEVFTSETSLDNIALYKKLGYALYGRKQLPPPETTVLVLMEKFRKTK